MTVKCLLCCNVFVSVSPYNTFQTGYQPRLVPTASACFDMEFSSQQLADQFYALINGLWQCGVCTHSAAKELPRMNNSKTNTKYATRLNPTNRINYSKKYIRFYLRFLLLFVCKSKLQFVLINWSKLSSTLTEKPRVCFTQLVKLCWTLIVKPLQLTGCH